MVTYYLDIAVVDIVFLRILMHSPTFEFAALQYFAPLHLLCYWQAPIQLTCSKASLLTPVDLLSAIFQGRVSIVERFHLYMKR